MMKENVLKYSDISFEEKASAEHNASQQYIGSEDDYKLIDEKLSFNDWLLKEKIELCLDKVEIPSSVKLVIVGDTCVGKTYVLQTLYGAEAFPIYFPSVLENAFKTVMVDGSPVDLMFWDTSGMEDFPRSHPAAYQSPQTGVLLVCVSIAEPDSYENARHIWFPEVKRYCPKTPVLLVGTNSNLRYDQETVEKLKKNKLKPITYDQGVELAKEIRGANYFESSATSNVGAEDIRYGAILAVLKNKTQAKRKKFGGVFRLCKGK